MDDAPPPTWSQVAATAALVFAVAFVGCGGVFAFWLMDLHAPQMAILGSGDRLSIVVIDGPARLVLASGNDAINYENAMSRVRPIFARRVDVLLAAGSGESLLVPLAAHEDPHARVAAAVGPLPPSPETAALGALSALPGHYRIRLGSSITVTVETRYPFGADPAVDPAAWRAIVEHGETRVVVLSDGDAASLFPPVNPSSVVVVSGDDPLAGWSLSPAPAVIANAEAIDGPDLRSAFVAAERPPDWGFLVFPGEALRLRFVQGGIEIPSESAHALG